MGQNVTLTAVTWLQHGMKLFCKSGKAFEFLALFCEKNPNAQEHLKHNSACKSSYQRNRNTFQQQSGKNCRNQAYYDPYLCLLSGSHLCVEVVADGCSIYYSSNVESQVKTIQHKEEVRNRWSGQTST